MQDFVADVVLLPVLHGSQFDFKETYLAYHRSCEVNWNDEAYVRWYPYDNLSGDVPEIPDVEVKAVETTASDMLVKKWVRFLFAVSHPQHRTNFTEVADALSLVPILL